jgi:hypothetical protein
MGTATPVNAGKSHRSMAYGMVKYTLKKLACGENPIVEFDRSLEAGAVIGGTLTWLSLDRNRTLALESAISRCTREAVRRRAPHPSLCHGGQWWDCRRTG